MPASPVGNMNFVNQNMTYPATQASNELAKEGFASMLNMLKFNEKEKIVNSLERINQSQEIREEIREKSEQEEKKKKNKQNDQTNDEKQDIKENLEPEFEDTQSTHRLDISV